MDQSGVLRSAGLTLALLLAGVAAGCASSSRSPSAAPNRTKPKPEIPRSIFGVQRTEAREPEASLFTGKHFEMLYPTGFAIPSNDRNVGGSYETIFDYRHYLIRVDESRHASTVEHAMSPMRRRLRHTRGYVELSARNVRYEHYWAIRWEYGVPEHGVLEHNVDITFRDERGRVWSVLVGAPASDWGRVSGMLNLVSDGLVITDP